MSETSNEEVKNVYDELKKLVKLSTEDQDEAIEDLADDFDKNPKRLRQQLDIYVKEIGQASEDKEAEKKFY